VKTNEQTQPVVIDGKNFDALFRALSKRGYDIIGPTVQEGAIVYDSISDGSALPSGWTDEQEAGKYRLVNKKDKALFGFSSSPQSWKKFIHPPALKLWESKRNGNRITISAGPAAQQKFAFVGVRACDLSAIGVLDKVFVNSPFTDAGYQSRRSDILIIAINCTKSGGTCFCASMNAGPEVSAGYDIVLTEVITKDRHYFLAAGGTKPGVEIIKDIPHAEADVYEIEVAAELVAKTAGEMKRKVDTNNIREILFRNSENNRWNETAKRCLTCANCTMVCPTCFCTTIEDFTDLTGKEASRVRKWDSCFTMDFTYIHGGSIRSSVYSRYRQWLTHKFAAWQDQFETYGCVGCGRCITWCPVGIDITEEIQAIRNTDKDNPSITSTKENR